MRNRLIISLLCNSLIFFFILIIMFAGNLDLSQFIVPIIVIAGVISLTGSILALNEIREISPVWYLGIPNTVALILVCCAFLAELLTHSRHEITVPFVILAVTTMLFFLSFPDNLRKITRYYAIGSGLAAVYSFFIFLLYSSFIMPLLGFFYIFTAVEVVQRPDCEFHNPHSDNH
jgi:hypothetical protein